METNRIRQFRTIVETGNMRKASHLLGISHSGLSKSMKALQEEVGLRLFEPVGRGIVISDDGLLLYRQSADFLESLELLLGKKSVENKAVVRLGSFEVFTSYFIGKAVKNYLSDVELEVHELTPGRLEEALILNKIDLGITYEPLPRPGVDYVKITRVKMGAYKVRGAGQVPFVAPVSPLEGTPSGVRGRDGWPEETFARVVRYRVDLMTTGLELVRQGLCAIFIPDFVARLYNETAAEKFQLEGLELPKKMTAVTRDVFIAKRESTSETKAMKQIAKALRGLHQ